MMVTYGKEFGGPAEFPDSPSYVRPIESNLEILIRTLGVITAISTIAFLRFKVLRDEFFRLHKALKDESSTEKKEWKYYKELLFLQDDESSEWYLAHGDSVQSKAWQFRVGLSTVYGIIPETCRAICKALQPFYAAPMTQRRWKKVADGYLERWQFPNCLGALDGKHIRMKKPRNSGSQYFNYRKFFSIVLMATCDAQYRFTWFDIGQFGSHDEYMDTDQKMDVVCGVGADIAYHRHVMGYYVTVASALIFFLEITWAITMFVQICLRNDESHCLYCWTSVLMVTRGWHRALFYLPLSCILAWKPHNLWLSFVAAGLLAFLSLLHIISSALSSKRTTTRTIDSMGESLLNTRPEAYDRFEEVLVTEVLDDGVSGPTSDGEM